MPLAHGRHTASDVAPLITEKVPEGHLLHAAAESAPRAELHVPGGHREQSLGPEARRVAGGSSAASAKRPAAHFKQLTPDA